jgi:hypothetical protein
MTGLPDNNFPAFDAVRDLLRARGDNPFSPADLDRKLGLCTNSRGCAARDIEEILKNCHGIYLLNGWEKSLGAACEFFLARFIAKTEPDFTFECENGSMNPLWDFAAAHYTAEKPIFMLWKDNK